MPVKGKRKLNKKKSKLLFCLLAAVDFCGHLNGSSSSAGERARGSHQLLDQFLWLSWILWVCELSQPCWTPRASLIPTSWWWSLFSPQTRAQCFLNWKWSICWVPAGSARLWCWHKPLLCSGQAKPWGQAGRCELCQWILLRIFHVATASLRGSEVVFSARTPKKSLN